MYGNIKWIFEDVSIFDLISDISLSVKATVSFMLSISFLNSLVGSKLSFKLAISEIDFLTSFKSPSVARSFKDFLNSLEIFFKDQQILFLVCYS